MSLHIIIDGYNLIRQSERFSSRGIADLQQEREALVDALCAYKKVKRHKISLIFDGTQSPPFAKLRDHVRGINIRYSRRGETADAVIQKMAAHDREKAVVVSSDREIITFAESQGAATIDSAQFEAKLNLAEIKGSDPAKSEETLDRNLSTRKKGPSKRLSKRKRRNRVKTRKL